MQRNKGFNTIRWRMTIGYFFITLAGFSLVLFLTTRIIENFLLDQRVKKQQEQIAIVARNLSEDFASMEGAQLYYQAQQIASEQVGRVLLLDKNAVVQVDSNAQYNYTGMRIVYQEVAGVLWGGQDRDFGYHRYVNADTDGQGFWQKTVGSIFTDRSWSVYYVQALTYNNPSQENGRQVVGALLFSADIQDVMLQVNGISRQISLVLVLVLIAAVMLSVILATSLTKPIVTLTSVIRRMSHGELNLRVKMTGSKELVELGRTFNDMSERLEQTEQVRNEFVSSASHEIKTPLATMKILVESLLYQDRLDEATTREFLGDVNKEINRLDAVITDLLRLVQADKLGEEVALKHEAVRVDMLCADVIKRLMPVAGQCGVAVEMDLQETTATADTLKLEQAIFNVVDNAIKYTDNGGSVYVSVCEEGGFARISVRDTGMGIPQKDLPMIFERFYRVDKARSRETGGTGLGLSIVDSIVKMHGGKIGVSSEEGVGTEFVIRIPK